MVYLRAGVLLSNSICWSCCLINRPRSPACLGYVPSRQSEMKGNRRNINLPQLLQSFRRSQSFFETKLLASRLSCRLPVSSFIPRRDIRTSPIAPALIQWRRDVDCAERVHHPVDAMEEKEDIAKGIIYSQHKLRLASQSIEEDLP